MPDTSQPSPADHGASPVTAAVYRAIWNADYDTVLAEKGRTAAHRLAEEVTAALAAAGLLANTMPAADEQLARTLTSMATSMESAAWSLRALRRAWISTPT